MSQGCTVLASMYPLYVLVECCGVWHVDIHSPDSGIVFIPTCLLAAGLENQDEGQYTKACLNRVALPGKFYLTRRVGVERSTRLPPSRRNCRNVQNIGLL